MNEELALLLQDEGYIGQYLRSLNERVLLDHTQWSSSQNAAFVDVFVQRLNEGGMRDLNALVNTVVRQAIGKKMRPYAMVNDKVNPANNSVDGVKENLDNLVSQLYEAREYLGNRGYVLNTEGSVEKVQDVPVTIDLEYKEAVRELAYIANKYDSQRQHNYLKSMGAPTIPLQTFPDGKSHSYTLKYNEVKDEVNPAGVLAVDYINQYRVHKLFDTKNSSYLEEGMDLPVIEGGVLSGIKAAITGQNPRVVAFRSEIRQLPTFLKKFNDYTDAKIASSTVESITKKQLEQAGATLVPNAMDFGASQSRTPLPPAPVQNNVGSGNNGVPATQPILPQPIQTAPTPPPKPTPAPTTTPAAAPASPERMRALEAQVGQIWRGENPSPDATAPTAMPTAETLPPVDLPDLTPQPQATPNAITDVGSAAPLNPNDPLTQADLARQAMEAYEKGRIGRTAAIGFNMLGDTINAINAGMRLNGEMPEYEISPELREAYRVAKRAQEEGLPDIAREIMTREMKRVLDADQSFIKQTSGGSGGTALGNRLAGIRTYYEGLAKIEALDADAKLRAMPAYLDVANKIEDQHRKKFEDKLNNEIAMRESAANLLGESMTRLNNTAQFQSSFGPGSMSDIYQWSNLMLMNRNANALDAGNMAFVKEQQKDINRPADAQTQSMQTRSTGQYLPEYRTTGTNVETGNPIRP